MPDQPRVAVVGAGRWGRNLVRNFHALGALAGVCDTDPGILAEHARRMPALFSTTDLDALLKRSEIDAVALATPTVTHAALATRCLAAGKSLFVEKPLCMDPGDARRLTALARADGLQLMTGHLLLFHPAFRALSAFVRGGGVGELRYIGAQRLNFRPTRSADDVLWDIAPHDVSMILALTGRLPDAVTATAAAAVDGERTDTLHANLHYADGPAASLTVSWIHTYKEQRLVIAGSEAIAVFDDLLPGPRKLMYQRQFLDPRVPDQVLRDEAEPIPYEDDEPLARECRHFLACLASGENPETGFVEAHAVVRVLAACERAAAERKPVDPGPL